MRERNHYINYNPCNPTPAFGFCKHEQLENAKKEAVGIMKHTGQEIYIYQIVGVIKPMPDHIFEEATDEVPF